MNFVAGALTSDRQASRDIEGMGYQARMPPLSSSPEHGVCLHGICPLCSFVVPPSQPTPSPSGTDAIRSAPDTAAKTGAISGTVVDKDGAEIPNAAVVLTEGSFSLQSVSGGDGSFAFKDVPAGSFDLSVSASGFATQHQSGILQPGEQDVIPPVQLVVATTIEVNVTQTREEIAEDQIHVEEQQRIFGVVPNYFVSYVPDAAPLNTRQKFQLSWKFAVNPFSFGISG